MSRCATGTVYRVSQVSKATFLAENQGFAGIPLCPKWDTRGTVGTIGTGGTLGTNATHGTPVKITSAGRQSSEPPSRAAP